MHEYANFWNHYADFSGRSSRRDYWMTFLINVMAGVILVILTQAAHPFIYLYGAFGIAVIIPSLAIAVRRLHDIGRSGWWMIVYFVPVVGPIILIVWLATRSGPDNQWGPTHRVA